MAWQMGPPFLGAKAHMRDHVLDLLTRLAASLALRAKNSSCVSPLRGLEKSKRSTLSTDGGRFYEATTRFDFV